MTALSLFFFCFEALQEDMKATIDVEAGAERCAWDPRGCRCARTCLRLGCALFGAWTS